MAMVGSPTFWFPPRSTYCTQGGGHPWLHWAGFRGNFFLKLVDIPMIRKRMPIPSLTANVQVVTQQSAPR